MNDVVIYTKKSLNTVVWALMAVIFICSIMAVVIYHNQSKIDQFEAQNKALIEHAANLSNQNKELQKTLDNALIAESNISDAVTNKVIQPVSNSLVASWKFVTSVFEN